MMTQMKKIIYFVAVLFLLKILNGCGYQPIYSSQNINLKIVNQHYEGSADLAQRVYAKINNKLASGYVVEISKICAYKGKINSIDSIQEALLIPLELINLIDARYRDNIDRNTSYEHALEHLYWQAAGKDFKTGKKSYLLKAFEEKYKNEFIAFTKEYNTINLYSKFKSLPQEVKENESLLDLINFFIGCIKYAEIIIFHKARSKAPGNRTPLN